MTGEKRIRGEKDGFNKKEKGKTEMSRLGLPKASRTICPGWPREKLWKREVSKERTHGRPGRPRGGRLAGGAKTAGGAIPLPWGLPFSGPLAEPLKATPGEFLDEPFGGPGVGGGRSEEKLSLPLKVPLSAPLPLTV